MKVNRKILKARQRQQKIGIHWTRNDFEFWWRNLTTKVVNESREREKIKWNMNRF